MPKTIHRAEYRQLIRKLREAREQAGLTQVQLARGVRKRQTWLSDIEIGTRRLDVIELRDLCRAMDIDFIDFLRDFERSLVSPSRR
jgi:transcriptional regulator with XRE-family HTH domain